MDSEVKIKTLIIDYEFRLKDRCRRLKELEDDPEEEKCFLLYTVRTEVKMLREFIDKLKH